MLLTNTNVLSGRDCQITCEHVARDSLLRSAADRNFVNIFVAAIAGSEINRIAIGAQRHFVNA